MHSEDPPLRRLIPALVALPLTRPNLVWLLMLAVLVNLAGWLPLPAPDNLFVMLAPIYILALHRACHIMELTTYGKFSAKAQRMKVKPDPERRSLPWKVMLLPALGMAAIGCTLPPQSDAFALASLVLALFMPGMVMLTWADNHILAGANLPRLLRLIGASRLAYLFFAALLFGLLMLPRLWQGLPSALQSLTLPALTFGAVYLVFILFYLFGFTLRRHQHELGLSAQLAFEEASTAGGDELSTDALIATRLANGQIDAAISIARNAVMNSPQQVKAHERLYRLLLTAGDHAGAQRQRIELFAANLKQANSRRALNLYRELLATPGYALAADHVLPLARMAVKESDFKLAINLLSDFERNYPGHPDTPLVQLYAAQLICARLGANDLARQLLHTLIHDHPAHQAATEAKRLLARIQT